MPVVVMDCCDHRVCACEGKRIIGASDEGVDVAQHEGTGVGDDNDGDRDTALFKGLGERGG